MLPERFCERMKELLGEDYEAFISSLELPAVKALRINETKISVEDFLCFTALLLTPTGYAKEGYIISAPEGIGNTPEHHAGMFYVQDPGAMATVKALEVKKGWQVLDACAAPGGKSSQIASLIGEKGFLISNEFVPKRAKIIVSNFERLGIKNAVVLSCDTAKFKDMFENCFDLVLCDAPCSGEGMFRKYDAALTEWSEDNIHISAKRQAEILNNLAPLVREGGYLLYSTCTYAPEENEENIANFLKNHGDYRLVPVSERLLPYTADGIATEGLTEEEQKNCRRFYPSKAPGEGQFIALMQRISAGEPQIYYKDEAKPLPKSEERIVNDFFKENMKKMPSGRLIKQGEYAVILPFDFPLPKYSVFMAGVVVGEIKGARLLPHHQFFSAYGKDMKNKEELSENDSALKAYLRGEEINANTASDGWCAVTLFGVPIGGGKVSQKKLKNHYPKGLRIK